MSIRAYPLDPRDSNESEQKQNYCQLYKYILPAAENKILYKLILRYTDSKQPLYQLNNPKGYKTSGIRKKNHPFVFQKIKFLPSFFPYFLFKFIFLAYECTFTSANHIIFYIGYLEKTGKKIAVILMKSNFLQFF